MPRRKGAPVLVGMFRRAGIATVVLVAVGFSSLRAADGAITLDYDTAGRTWRVTDECGITRILNYDPVIGIATSGVKIAGDPSNLIATGSDRIQQHNYAINSFGEANIFSVFLTNGSAAATQLLSVSNSFDGTQVSRNVAGRTTSVQASPFTGPAAFTVDASLPNGVSTHATYGPLGLSSLQKKDANGIQTGQTTFSPDAGGLNVQIQDSARGLQNLVFDQAGRLRSIDAASAGGASTTVEYLPGTDLPTSITGGGKTWTATYYPNGLPKVISASGAPTAQYTWDTMARITSMTLTSSSGTVSVTTWNRDPHTGRLVNKMVNGNVVETYAWRANGQPDTVARPNGTIQNQYNAAGDPTALVDTPTNYAAETVTTVYDRPGNVLTNAVAGGISEGYTRHIDGTLLGVQIAGNGVMPDYTIAWPQNFSSGQALGYALSQGGSVRNLAIAYNASGFVMNLAEGTLASSYGWTPGGCATNITWSVAGVPSLSLANGWNEALGVRSNMAFTMNGAIIASFAFERGPGTNQITKITREDGSTREISYDDNGRLAGWKYKNAAGVADYDRSWLYSYDGARNLISAGRDPSIPGGPIPMSPMAKDYATKNIRTTSQFDVDSFNFHTVRRWNAVDLVFYAAANARVTVNGMAARRNGTRFVVSIPLAQNSPASVTNLTVCAVMSTGTNSESYFTNTVQVSLPSFPETIETMLASAVTSDSMAEYLYDARGRLRRVTDKLGTTAQRLQSILDYYPDDRRARKTVTIWDGSTWQPYRTCQYIYDRWNLLREIVTENGTTTTRDFTWGLDLAGLQDGQWAQDAGGIGGLLAITEVVGNSTNIFLPICDHVGTVHALVAAVTNNVTLTTPAIVAQYEFEPYGNLIAQDGPYANSCPFLFMSKYRDQETGLIYFGYRYYDPKSGMWMTRDPLGLAAGPNETQFCGGDPVNNTDGLGLDWFPKNFSVVNGVPMMEIADYNFSMWNASAGWVERQGSAIPVPAAGQDLDYFQKDAQGNWQVKSAADRRAVGIANGFAVQHHAYEQFFKIQEAQATLSMAAPAAAEGVGSFLTEAAWNELGLPSPKTAWRSLKGGWSLARSGTRYLNPGNWTFATDRMFVGMPIPKFVGNTAETLLPNAEVRAWYNAQVRTLDTSGELTKETAARVHAARNALKLQARGMMADRAAAEQLAREQPLQPLEYYIEKYGKEGYQGETLWRRIIEGGITPNEGVNRRFGLE